MKKWGWWLVAAAALLIILNPEAVQLAIDSTQVVAYRLLNAFLPIIVLVLGVGFLWKKVFK